jgi:glycosyltransferase involved in cell wall biosynthesis
VPLGIAIAHFIAETGFPTIAHHHDFYWERDRFTINGIADILGMAFPPALPTIQHATINTPAQSALARRTGVSSTLIPNVLDFANAPPALDDYSTDFRQSIGLTQDDILFLQPTRVVPRKGIEHAIQLVAAVKDPRCKLIISHESGDEGHAYLSALTEMAAQQGVDMRIVATKVSENRATDAAGSKIYTLADAYSHADFITYPSLYEGFGNALLEAFYFKKPVLVNRYSIYISDIEPKGFDVIAMSGYITRDTVEHVRKVIRDDEYRQRMVNHNYEVAKKFFSYEVLRRKLQALVANLTGNDLW